jgi:phosphatidylinositol alpha-mannosyltransferase
MNVRRFARAAGRLLVVALLVVTARSIPWPEVAEASRRASPSWLVLATLVHALLLPLGAWQWMRLVPAGDHIPFARMLWIRCVGWAIANGGPFMAEHAASIHLLAKRGGVGYAGGTSIKILDQATTGLSKLILLAAAVIAVPLPQTLRSTALALVIGFAVLWLLLLASVRWAHLLDRWSADRTGSARAAIAFLARVSKRLSVFRRGEIFGGGLLFALAQRAAECVACWAVVNALGVSISLPGVFLVVTAVNLSTMMSITPANLGLFEGSAFVALRATGLASEHALAIAVLLHLSYLLPMAGVGWFLLAADGIGRRRRSLAGEGLRGTAQ